MKLSFFFPLILFYTVNSLLAQTPSVMWQKCLGGKYGEYANSVEPTADDGFIVAGYAEGPDNADIRGYHGSPLLVDIWIVKKDITGNIHWQKLYGDSKNGYANVLPMSADGGYIITGEKES